MGSLWPQTFLARSVRQGVAPHHTTLHERASERAETSRSVPPRDLCSHPTISCTGPHAAEWAQQREDRALGAEAAAQRCVAPPERGTLGRLSSRIKAELEQGRLVVWTGLSAGLTLGPVAVAVASPPYSPKLKPHWPPALRQKQGHPQSLPPQAPDWAINKQWSAVASFASSKMGSESILKGTCASFPLLLGTRECWM